MSVSGITGDTGGTNTLTNQKSQLKAGDFIKLLITQLQNQDPTKPTSNAELLQQVSQIGQLQSNTELSSTLKVLSLQNTIGAAGNLIGKQIEGLDTDGAPLEGQVTSVRVQDSKVFVELDNGKTLPTENITSIATAATKTTATPAAKAA